MKATLKLSLFVLVGFFMFSFTGKEVKTMEIKTTTVCEMCKERIERELVFTKGVKEVKVDLEKNIITVKYRTDKVSPENIRKAVSKMGYWADDVPADEEAFKKLPECCQKEGCGKKG